MCFSSIPANVLIENTFFSELLIRRELGYIFKRRQPPHPCTISQPHLLLRCTEGGHHIGWKSGELRTSVAMT